jgi:hypothetical protein
MDFSQYACNTNYSSSKTNGLEGLNILISTFCVGADGLKEL